MVASLERQFDDDDSNNNDNGPHHGKKKLPQRGGKPRKGDGPPGAEAGRNWRAGVKDGGPTARLKALSQFQYRALTKAFSFPQVNLKKKGV